MLSNLKLIISFLVKVVVAVVAAVAVAVEVLIVKVVAPPRNDHLSLADGANGNTLDHVGGSNLHYVTHLGIKTEVGIAFSEWLFCFVNKSHLNFYFIRELL